MLFLGSLVLGLGSCRPNQTTSLYYSGQTSQDSVFLRLEQDKSHFYSHLTFKNDTRTLKTGQITGEIKGDTLLGDYLYSAYGAQPKRAPLALLKDSSTYRAGKGVVSSYMGVPFFVKHVPIDFEDPEYILSFVRSSESSSE